MLPVLCIASKIERTKDVQAVDIEVKEQNLHKAKKNQRWSKNVSCS